MKLIHWGRARKFIQEHPDARKPLYDWKRAVRESEWTNFPDVRCTFTTADWIEGKIVFNFEGNDYRLIAIAAFRKGKLYIRQVLTRDEYDRRDWKT